MADHRIEENGRRLDFTCQNRGYRTAIRKGHPHGEPGTAGGSVFPDLLEGNGDPYSLWLEYVVPVSGLDSGEDMFWLMWYNNGRPESVNSAVFRSVP